MPAIDNTKPPRCSAIAAGLVCLDIIPGMQNIEGSDFDRQFLPGKLIETDETILSTGGSVSNTGLAMHRLGIDTKLICRIGNDSFAEILKGLYQKVDHHLLDSLIVDADHMTGHAYVINPRNQDRRFFHHPGSSDYFTAEDVDDAILKTAGLFHFGYPPMIRTMIADEGSELLKLYKKVKAYGLTTSMDMCMPDPSRSSGQAPWKKILLKTLPFVDFFLPSIEELLFMLNRALYERLAETGELIGQVDDALLFDLSQQLLEMGCKVILIKMGYRGVYLRTSDEKRLSSMGTACPSDLASWANLSIKQPSFEVEVKGTCGSGDTCIAGFLSAILRDFSPEDTLKIAVGSGACCCEQPDAFSGLLSWDELCNRINSSWKTKTEF